MPVTEVTRIDREASQWDEASYAFLGQDLATMTPDESIWPPASDARLMKKKTSCDGTCINVPARVSFSTTI